MLSCQPYSLQLGFWLRDRQHATSIYWQLQLRFVFSVKLLRSGQVNEVIRTADVHFSLFLSAPAGSHDEYLYGDGITGDSAQDLNTSKL